MHYRLFTPAALLVLTACSDSYEPAPPRLPEEGFVDVAIAGGRSCAVDVGGTLYCWGPRDGDDGDHPTVPEQQPQDEALVELTAQGWLVCGVGESEAVYCSGEYVHDKNFRSIEAEDLDRTREMHGVVVSAAHGCGLNKENRVECFGSMLSGKVGRAWDPAGADSVRYHWPNRPIASNATFLALAAGYEHSCGISSERQVLCWGDSLHVGNPGADFIREANPCGASTRACTFAPEPVTGLAGVTSLAAGLSHTCAVATSGVWCWGHNGAGQLGVPGAPSSAVPVEVALPSRAELVASGNSLTCVVSRNARVYCWGQYGGDQAREPEAVPGSYPHFTHLAVGEAHACGLAGGEMWCWGINGSRIGNGTTTGSPSPVRIALPPV
jgi:alpha-tubulin suppressor-like RCC1 family protein